MVVLRLIKPLKVLLAAGKLPAPITSHILFSIENCHSSDNIDPFLFNNRELSSKRLLNISNNDPTDHGWRHHSNSTCYWRGASCQIQPEGIYSKKDISCCKTKWKIQSLSSNFITKNSGVDNYCFMTRRYETGHLLYCTPYTSSQQLARRHFSTAAVNQSDKSKFTLDNPKLKTYLEKIRLKYDELTVSPSKSAYKLKPIVVILEKIESAQHDVSELQGMLAEPDKEMAELAAKDLTAAVALVDSLTKQLLDALVCQANTQAPSIGRDITLEVSGGVGGLEAMLFCHELWTMYQSYAAKRGWSFVQQQYDESEQGGLRSGLALVSSLGHEDLYAVLRYEAGIHRVQRVPKTERKGRVHTSTVSVVVMLEPKEVDIKFEKKDLKIETMRSKGAGGQSVNTTDSAVRITHKATGIAVEAQEERMQYQNMVIAKRKLWKKLYDIEQDKEVSASMSSRRLQVGTRGRSEKIRTYNFNQDRITDHRIGFSVHNIAGVLSGGDTMDNLLERLQEFAREETIQLLLESNP